MDEAEAWAEISRALAQAGFERDWSAPRPTFVGLLDPEGLAANVTVEITDADFVAPPIIRLAEPGVYGRIIAHVTGPGGQLCYLDARARVLDRYHPGPTALACLETATTVLKQAVAGTSDDYFLDDFAAYWGGDFVYADLDDTAKTGEISWLALGSSRTELSGVLAAKDGLAASLLARHRRVTGSDAAPDTTECPIISVSGALRVDPGRSWPPRDFKALCEWLDEVASGTTSVLDRRFNETEGVRRTFGLRAANGLFVFAVEIPSTLVRPEFLKSRRGRLTQNLRGAYAAQVTRMATVRIDAAYLYARNLAEGSGFAGKAVALIGCGSIGGFLAGQLARTGAGADGGRLLLIDPDKFLPSNMGRHVLTLSALNQNKAEALREQLQAELPHLEVAALARDALAEIETLAGFDLIVDATGEEAFSIALNHRAVSRPSFPPVLYAWLHGNGVAAEALLADTRKTACYKCLKPELAGQPRFRVVRPGVETLLTQNYACGDALFVTYPVSRAVSAAALALDVALDWSSGHPAPRHRVQSFKPQETFKTKASDPPVSSQCPACRLTQSS